MSKKQLVLNAVLSTVVTLTLLTGVSHGQIRGVEAGSAEAAAQLEKFRQHDARTRREYARSKEVGRELFGDAKPRTLKKSLTFRVGDWGHVYLPLRVLNKVSKNECLVIPRPRGSKVMLLRGLDMSKVTDGVEFVLPHYVFIQSTFSYTTVVGAKKTVLVLEYNESKLKEFIAKAQAEQLIAKAKEEEAAAKAKAQAWQERWEKEKRTWSNKTGKFSVEAVYDESLGKGKIRLLKKDKSEIIIHLSKLSDRDRRKAIEKKRANDRRKAIKRANDRRTVIRRAGKR